jgi:hypothetical protein
MEVFFDKVAFQEMIHKSRNIYFSRFPVNIGEIDEESVLVFVSAIGFQFCLSTTEAGADFFGHFHKVG